MNKKHLIFLVLLFLLLVYTGCAVKSGMYYQVQRGDTLSGIQNKFNIPIETIERANDRSKLYPYLQAGATLFLPGVREKSDIVAQRVAVNRTRARSEARTDTRRTDTQQRAEVPARRPSSTTPAPPQSPTPPQRPPAERRPSPVQRPTDTTPAQRPQQRSPRSNIRFIFPLKDGEVVGRFGVHDDYVNRGIDIASTNNEDVIASADGKVIFSGAIQGYGNVIFVSHRDNFTTVYGNNSKNLVRQGDNVKQGTPIAVVGHSRRYQRRILHFEIRKLNTNGEIDIINPLDLIER